MVEPAQASNPPHRAASSSNLSSFQLSGRDRQLLQGHVHPAPQVPTAPALASEHRLLRLTGLLHHPGDPSARDMATLLPL